MQIFREMKTTVLTLTTVVLMQTRPDGYITNVEMQWHPLVAGSISLVTAFILTKIWKFLLT